MRPQIPIDARATYVSCVPWDSAPARAHMSVNRVDADRFRRDVNHARDRDTQGLLSAFASSASCWCRQETKPTTASTTTITTKTAVAAQPITGSTARTATNADDQSRQRRDDSAPVLQPMYDRGGFCHNERRYRAAPLIWRYPQRTRHAIERRGRAQARPARCHPPGPCARSDWSVSRPPSGRLVWREAVGECGPGRHRGRGA